MNYSAQARFEVTDANRFRSTKNKPNRLRELARLRSLHIQPLSPSSKSRKDTEQNKFTFEDDAYKSPVDVDDVSICMSPSHLAVEARLPDTSPRINVAEVRHVTPGRPSQRQKASPLSPSEGTKTILDSPRMKNLRKQHQQRSGSAAVESANASLRRAQHHRRYASKSRDRQAQEDSSTDTNVCSSKTSAVRHRSTGRSIIVNRCSVAAPKTDAAAKSSAAASLLRARKYRRSVSNSKETGKNTVAPTPKASNATARTRPRSKSPPRPSNANISIELNDSDIFTDFHLVMMAASSDDSTVATASSLGSKSSLSGRRMKLMGRKFKSISKSKPSHHNAIAKLVAQKKKNVHIPISQLCHCIVPIQALARMFLAKLAAEKRIERIVVVQSLIRRWKCLRYLSSCKFFAIQLQACYRGYIAREEAIIVHAQTFAATQLQACYRGISSRSKMRYESYCATKIQALWRGFLEHLIYCDVVESAILIQSIARMRRQRKMFLFVQNARRVLEEQMQAAREEAAALKLQTFWRSSSCRLRFCNTVIDIVIVQSVIRRWSGFRLAKKMQTERHAAITIQSWIRGRFKYLDFMLVLSAAVVIQTAIRRIQAIQKLDHLRMKRHETETTSVTKMAAQWRRYAARSKYFNILIGEWLSLFTPQLFELMNSHSMHFPFITDVIICQSVARRYLAVKKVDCLRQERELYRQACATMIQKAWRCARVREVTSKMIFLKQMEVLAAITIAKSWRKFVYQEAYRCTLRGMLSDSSASWSFEFTPFAYLELWPP